MPKVRFSYPRGNYPRLCLAGNSNVGKSSLTKLLLSQPGRYKGKVGKTAGSTVRLMIINDPKLNYHVIDLPGFGRMARLSRKEEAFVQDQIIKYVELDRKNIFLMIYVISADRLEDELDKWYFQHEETIPLSIEFIQLILKNKIPCVIVLNKIDKLNVYKLKSMREKFSRVLNDFEISVASPNAKQGVLAILETCTVEKKKIGVKQLQQLIRSRSAKLKMKNFDPRGSLFDRDPIDVAHTKKKAKKKKEEYDSKNNFKNN